MTVEQAKSLPFNTLLLVLDPHRPPALGTFQYYTETLSLHRVHYLTHQGKEEIAELETVRVLQNNDYQLLQDFAHNQEKRNNVLVEEQHILNLLRKGI